MKRIITFTFLLVLAFQFQAEAKKTNWRKGILVDEFIYTEAPYPSCHSATIAETSEGLVAAWFGGTKERNPDVGIWVSRQIDGKWTESVEVANGIQNDTLRYPSWNPVLFQMPGGDLLLFYKIGPSPSEWWGMMMRSSDNGKTWSQAERLPDGIYGPIKNKPILLADGTLMSPCSVEGDGGWRSYFEFTKDEGKTWEKGDYINDGKMYMAIQPAILTYPDGRMQTLVRTRNAVIASSWSTDQGKSWGLMQPSGLPNNNSGIDAVSLKDGRQLVVYNHVKTPVNAPKGHRTPLNVAVSKDGKHWEAALVLEDSEISQYSYPAVIQTSDGLVHFVYTWRRKRIKHVVVDPKKLKTKKIVYEQWPE
ncbi:exo-alpha-sialidase [Mangrovibacterium marinum]|uniref:Putative neuraminidase n=1 Tax=Mangrovibacterium marinum TaxID=1639118 RepID=A0A2T5C447_9BACT|nr:sialidase family protein [Mangrovibacterium marinum]PTN09548.1 putative neuraminidase [Mangrovibacterium marinum]